MTKDKHTAGVDEAGRGAVVGPLVACCYAGGEETSLRLERSGVADSKKLTPSRRGKLFSLLIACAEEIRWAFLHPRAIDGENLNTLYSRHIIKLIQECGPGEAVVDAPVSGRGVERYGAYLQSLCQPTTIRALNRAEDASPFVAAASICAKVVRDRAIFVLSRRFGPLGSGYPSDPTTVAWLKDHYEEGVREGIVRSKWRLSCFQ